jgi:hypothetical protein
MTDDGPLGSTPSTGSPAPPRQPKPGELLFEFLHGHDRILCELRDDGEVGGVEAQFLRNEAARGRPALLPAHEVRRGHRERW